MAPYAQKEILIVATASDLRATNPRPDPRELSVIFLQGVASVSDGGQGFFYYDANSALPDDNFDVFISNWNATGTGCWRRMPVFSGPVSYESETYNVSSASFSLVTSAVVHLINNEHADAISVNLPTTYPAGTEIVLKDITQILNGGATFAAILAGTTVDGTTAQPLIQTPGGWCRLYTPDGTTFYRTG